MRKYWLYLESFTFVFKGIQGYLIFNSISNQSFLVSREEKVCRMIEHLLEPCQMYCIGILDIEINKYEIWPFVMKLRETFTGDLINNQWIKKKPIALYPIPSIMRSSDRLKVHPEKSIGQNLLSYLHELDIYITGRCQLHCHSCNHYGRQTTSCLKNDSEIDIKILSELLLNVKASSLYKINFIGGDIFNYSHWNEFCLMINNLQIIIKLYSHYKNILLNPNKIKDISGSINLCVIIPDTFSNKELCDSLDLLERNDLNYEGIFHITSPLQYSEAIKFCEVKGTKIFSILPIYTDSNEDFFHQNVFLDDESILSVPSSKKDIFSRMSLNTNNFGKLSILSNGDIFANINHPKLGNIQNDSLYDVLYQEMYSGKSWLNIRDQEPCNQCVYQWLCPSPSNYELAFGKPNLCIVM